MKVLANDGISKSGIKALEKGSFEIHIELVEKLIQSIFSNDAIQYASGIVTVVGGLYSFVKFLGGKKPKEIIQKGDKFEIVENNNKKVLHITDDNNNLLLKILIKTIEINEIEENLYKITV